MGLFDKGVQKTRRSFFERITRAIAARSTVSDGLLDAIEEALVATDMGVDTTLEIIDALEERVERDKYMSTEELVTMLREEIASLLDVGGASAAGGAGQVPGTASGGAGSVPGIDARFQKAGRKVVIGAADTFRAAAVDQLCIWAERSGADIVRQQMGSDPASVAYDTVKAAVARGADVVLIDTAGRLHNRTDLMNELTKIRNVMRKVVPDAPHEVMLVLDGSTGQNAFAQAREFVRATDVNSLAVTKLDGSAKGGVVIGIVNQMKIPVKFIGIGEGVEDLKVFDRKEYVENLFSLEDIAEGAGK